MATESKTAVFAAMAVNGTLTVIKFGAFMVSGSGAMLSESIHSLADTLNQGLLWMGINKSERPADATFHYGYGAERFFYALMSAVGIFVLGCGVTVYHGISTLLHPHALEVTPLVWGVLAVAFVFDGAVLALALHTVSGRIGDRGIIEYLRTESDPTILAVLFEDGVACLGILIAAGGLMMYQWTGNPVWDSAASITIGILLGLIAVYLGMKNRHLILGPGMSEEKSQDLRDFLNDQPSVIKVRMLRSRIVGTDRYRLQADLDFDGRWLGRQMADWMDERLPDKGDRHGLEEFAAQVGDQLMEAHASEVDRIEKELTDAFPRVSYVDLEGD